MDENYNMSKIVGKGVRTYENVKNNIFNRWRYGGPEGKSRIDVVGTKRLFVWGKRDHNSVDLRGVTINGVTKYTFHSHPPGAHNFSTTSGDIDFFVEKQTLHNFMVNHTQTHYYHLTNGATRVGYTNELLMRSIWGF